MIVSVCVATVARAPRWRRLGFNDCKGSGFGENHQTAKGKVASHAQPQTPEHPAPSMPEHPASPTPSVQPQACPSIQPPPPLSKAKPSHPAKAKPFRKAPCKRKTLPPHESHFRAHICARQEPAKNRQEPLSPRPLRTQRAPSQARKSAQK